MDSIFNCPQSRSWAEYAQHLFSSLPSKELAEQGIAIIGRGVATWGPISPEAPHKHFRLFANILSPVSGWNGLDELAGEELELPDSPGKTLIRYGDLLEPSDYLSNRVSFLLPEDWREGRRVENLRDWIAKNHSKVSEKQESFERALTDSARSAWRTASLLSSAETAIPEAIKADGKPEGWSAIRVFFSEENRPHSLYSWDPWEFSLIAAAEDSAFKKPQKPTPSYGVVDWASPSNRWTPLQALWEARWGEGVPLFQGIEALIELFERKEWKYLATYDGPWFDLLTEMWAESVQAAENPPDVALPMLNGFSQIPITLGSTFWGAGAAGAALDDLDGYTFTPSILALGPMAVRAGGLILRGGEGERPSQGSLPLGREDINSEETPVLLLAHPRTKEIHGPMMLPMEAKLQAVIYSLARGGSVSLGTLRKWIYGEDKTNPGRKRRDIVAGLEGMRSFFLYFPGLPGGLQCFDISRLPPGVIPDDETRVILNIGSNLREVLNAPQSPAGKWGNGRFPFALERYLQSLSCNDLVELRIYPQLCSHWNSLFIQEKGGPALYAPEREKVWTLEELARWSNSLSPEAVEYLASGKKKAGSGSVQTAKGKSKTWEGLEHLHAEGMLILEGTKQKGVKLLAHPDWREAKATFQRKSKGRSAQTPVIPNKPR